jgi:hypothetical protein
MLFAVCSRQVSGFWASRRRTRCARGSPPIGVALAGGRALACVQSGEWLLTDGRVTSMAEVIDDPPRPRPRRNRASAQAFVAAAGGRPEAIPSPNWPVSSARTIPFGALLGGDRGASRGVRRPLRAPGAVVRGSRAGAKRIRCARPQGQPRRGPKPSICLPDHTVALTAEEEALLHGHTDPRYSRLPRSRHVLSGRAELAESREHLRSGPAALAPQGHDRHRSRLGAAVLGTAGALTLRPAA